MPLVKQDDKGDFVPLDKFEPSEMDQPSLGYADIIGATFKTENTIGSYLNQEAGLPDTESSMRYDLINPNAPKVDYVDRALDDFKDQEFDSDTVFRFGNVRTDTEYAAMKRQVQEEIDNRKLISRADFGTQFLASMTAGVADIDPIGFIPGFSQIKKTATALNIAKQAAKGSIGGGLSGGATELLVDETQVTRSDDDVLYGALGGAAFGAILGGGVQAFRKMAGASELEKRLGKEISDGLDGKDAPESRVFGDSSASAAEVKQTTLEQEGLAGGAFAKGLGKLIAKDRFALDNKVVQGLNSSFKTARKITQELAESSGLKIKKAEEGIAVSKGGAIESLNKLAFGRLVKTNRKATDLWVEMRKGRKRRIGDVSLMDVSDVTLTRGKMTYRDFQREVGKAMRRDDTHEIPEVQQMAQFYRKEVFDPLVKEAVELDMLPEGVSVDTAASYFTRVYDIQRINQNPSEFAEITKNWMRDQQAKNADIQEKLDPLIQERENLQRQKKTLTKNIERGEKRGDILKAQTEEGFRYLRDIRNRLGIGKKTVQNMRNRYDGIMSNIFEKEGQSDKLITEFNNAVPAVMDDINEKLIDLFQSKKRAYADKKTFNAIVRKAKNLKEFYPKSAKPVMNFLKGRIDPDGRFADELMAMDITPKTFPGYFKKGGMTDVDNVPLNEFPELADFLGVGNDTNPDGYFAASDFLEGISEEMNGNPLIMYKDMGRFEKHQEIAAFKEDLERLNINLDDPDAFEKYGQVKEQEEALNFADAADDDGIQDIFEELDFYDRASDILPDIKKSVAEAEKRIAKMPAKKKVDLDRGLRELKSFIEELETSLSKDRRQAKKQADSLSKKEKELTLIENERGVIDRSATAKAKGRTKSLLKKIEDVKTSRSSLEKSEYRISELEDQITELAAQWNSKSGKEFKKHLENSEVPKAEKLNDIIKKIQNTETRLEDAELLSIAEEIRQRIVGTPDGRLPYSHKVKEDGSGGGDPIGSKEKPSMFKGRAFAIPDELIEKFLISDADIVASSYVKNAAPYMNMHRRFNGDTELINVRKELEAEYNDMVRGASPEDAARLAKEYKNSQEAILALRDRALGKDLMKSDPTSTGSRVARSIRTINYITLLGGMTFSALADAGRVALGGSPVLHEAIIPLIRNIGSGVALKKMHELNDAGVIVELATNNQVMKMHDIGDDTQTRTAIERGLNYAGDKFGIASMMSPWNEVMKQVAALGTEAAILKLSRGLLNGKISKKQITALANHGIDKEMAERIIKQFDTYGETHKGLNLLNPDDWDDRVAKEALLSALSREVDRLVVTPGYDASVNLNSSEFYRVVTQFKSFFMISTSRVLLRGLQDGTDPRNIGMFITMTGLGMMTYAIKTAQADKELSDNPAIWIIEGMDRGGVWGAFGEGHNIFEKATGLGLRTLAGGGVSSRYASRSAASSLFGPSLGRFYDLFDIARAVGTGEWTDQNANTTVSFIPGQNLPYIQPITNELKEALK